MSIHDKLIDRLYDYLQICWECGNGALEDAAQAIDEGRFDDLLGVREPTLDDVKREAVRVSGRDDVIVKDWIFSVVVRVIDISETGKVPDSVSMPLCIEAPTVASAYAALRALPDYEEEE